MADWNQAEKFYDQGTTAGYTLSLMEAERQLRLAAETKKIPGRNSDEKVLRAIKYTSSPQVLNHTRALVSKITSLQLPESISKQAAEQALRTYFTSITEVENIPKSKVLKEQSRYYTEKLSKAIAKILLWIIIVAALVVSTTIFLTDTESGRQVALDIAEISRIVAYKALPIALLSVLILAILIGVTLSRKNLGRDSIDEQGKNETTE